MMLLDLVSTPIDVANAPIILSLSALLAAGVGLFKVGSEAGRFREFKENMESDRKVATEANGSLVKRHEVDTLQKHIDQRFDALDKQMEGIRADVRTLATK